MKVLVGIDGAAQSVTALQFAAKLLSADRDEIAFYFAPPPRRWVSLFDTTTAMPPAQINAFRQELADRARNAISNQFRTRLVDVVPHTTPSDGLLQAANTESSDLIVVGAGRSSHRLRFFVGGVARRVIYDSNRPVLACRADSRSTSGPMSVLVAVDFDHPLDDICSYLHQFAWPEGTVGRLIHVMDYVDDERLRDWIVDSAGDASRPYTQAYQNEIDEDRQLAYERLVALKRQLPTIFADAEPILAIGHIVERIVEVVDSEDVDLLVVGGRAHGVVSRLLGSTTEGLLIQADAAILVVHALETE